MYLDLVDGCIRTRQSRGDSSPLDMAGNYFSDFGNSEIHAHLRNQCIRRQGGQMLAVQGPCSEGVCRRGARPPRRLGTFFEDYSDLNVSQERTRHIVPFP